MSDSEAEAVRGAEHRITPLELFARTDRRLAALTGLLAASLLHDLSDLILATSTPTRLPSMAMIPTLRLAMTPMSCEAMRAIMAADWQLAEGLLGTPFPTEWRNDGWGWLAPRVVEGDLDAGLLV